MGAFKKVLNLINPILKPATKWYLSKSRNYSYKGIHIKVFPGVFHPGFFFSTKFLLKYLGSLNLEKVRLLELGAGTGLISIYSYRRGAQVVATDINPTALKNIAKNAELNDAEIKTIISDLFEQVTLQDFDIIIINPPYYAKKIKSEYDLAWYCGENFEYFMRLFSQLSGRVKTSQKVLLILSEDCDLQKISRLAEENRLLLFKERTMKNFYETNYIFSVQNPIQSGS